MIATRGIASRAVLSFAQQVGLSILGTLAATAVVTAVQSEWSPRPAAPAPFPAETTRMPLPSLTQGGKFAARAIGGDEAEPFVTLTRLPVLLPLFTAPAVPRLDLDDPDPAFEIPALSKPETGRPVGPSAAQAHAAPRETRRAAGLPSRPHGVPEGTIVMAPLPTLTPPPTPEEHGLWTRPKAVYQTVASWSGAVLDSLLP